MNNKSKTEIINIFYDLTSKLNKLNKNEKNKLKKELTKLSKNKDIKLADIIVKFL